jgi:protein ImuA
MPSINAVNPMEATHMNLNHLIHQRNDLWRGGELAQAEAGIPTGFPSLDQELAGGGWPRAGVTELLRPSEGLGALDLLLPALARLSREPRWIALIGPPYLPYAPALAARGLDLSRLLLVHPKGAEEGLWAIEQALRSGTCGAVLAWPAELPPTSVRRLQLAARQGDCCGFLFRPLAAARQPSPAALRLTVTQRDGELAVAILKRRGGWPLPEMRLPTGPRRTH